MNSSTLNQHGLPRCIVFDRDPRLVGSWSTDEFPSAFMRFLLSLGIAIEVCPPHRPDLKPFVERYFRTLNSECIRVQRPENMRQVKEVFAEHRHTYNHRRPNQTKGCRNRPPYEAFPELPRLPAIAEMVDPDHWLLSYQHRVFKRRINTSGRIQIDKHRYYVRRELAGRYVICQLDTHCRVIEVRLGGKVIKTMPIKGLYNEPLEFGLYLELMLKEAAAERRRLEHRHRRWLAR